MRDPRTETRSVLLEEMVEGDPSTALYLPLAERLREEGRVDEAIRLCESRKNRPGHGVGDAIVLARCYLAAGRLAEARAEFEAALSLDRENVAALKALAGILAHEGRHPRAAELYRAVCRVDPGDLESQTALHQITSGEYADVCPADVVVEQGDLGWRPVRLPREEEHLSDLGLGLRTIEGLGEDPRAAAPRAEGRGAPFQELSLEELERATAGAADPTAGTTGATDPNADSLETADPTAAAPGRSVFPAPASVQAEPIAPSKAAPVPEPAPALDPTPAGPDEPVQGNRSAFEDWIRRLGGAA